MIAHDLFLVMINLFQLKDKDKVISNFLATMNDLIHDIEIKYVDGYSPNDNFKYELKTNTRFYGTLVFNNYYNFLSEENKFYLINSCALLSVILEKLHNEKLLKSDKESLLNIAKEKNEELKRSEENFRELYENIPVSLFRFTPGGNVLDINKAALKMYGFNSKNELTKRSVSEFYKNPDDRDKILKILLYEGEAHNIVTRETKKDNSEIWIKSNYKATFNPDNPSEILYIDGVALDITESKNYEKELYHYRDELEKRVNKRTKEIEQQSVKLRESQKALTFLLADVNESRKELENVVKELAEVNKDLESFSYSVSHDLRAPLRAINGFTQILKEDYNHLFDDEGKRIMNIIISNVSSMTQLIDDLLAFTRIGRRVVNKNKINTNNFIQSVTEELTSTLGKKPAIHIDNLPMIIGDLNLLKQVFINLISNAIKFSANVKNPTIKISGKEINNLVEISVKDNGIGFDDKYAEKIFEVFQRLHTVNEFEGAGVGLSIVKKIVEKHDGKIIARGNPGKGAEFIIQLQK